MMRNKSLTDFIIIIVKCFLVLIFFGLILPKIIDNVLFLMYKSNIYDNSTFVNFIVDKNNKLLYNYMYIMKLILNI
jgi:hypothetical protein